MKFSLICRFCGPVKVEDKDLNILGKGLKREVLFECPECYSATLAPLTTRISQVLLQIGTSTKKLFLPEEVRDVILVSTKYPRAITEDDVLDCMNRLDDDCSTFVAFCHNTIPTIDTT